MNRPSIDKGNKWVAAVALLASGALALLGHREVLDGVEVGLLGGVVSGLSALLNANGS